MNNTEITILKNNIRGQLANKQVAPICIAGAPGTAKSTTIDLIAKELNMNIVTESGPTLTHEILSGLPDTVDAPQYKAASIDGSDPMATLWSIPEMVAKSLRAAQDKPTILLIDDFHMVSPHLQAYFYGLLLERRLGNYRLSDNTVIVLTMNDSEAAGFTGINSAVRNRMAILKVEFNFEHWFTGYGNRLHYLVASYLKAKPSYCQGEETTTIEGYQTARAWTSVAKELEFNDSEFIKKHAGTIAGMQVSREAAMDFQRHVAYVSALDFESSVKNRTLIDLGTKDPIDSIIYAYITNFINTIDDGMYLFDFMEFNTKETSSAFIGFVIGELYTKYINEKELSEGLMYVIDRLIQATPNKEHYPNISQEKFKKAFEKQINSINLFQERAAEFII